MRPENEARYTGKAPEELAKYFGMLANMDDNFGQLLAKLKEWGIERETLVIFMNDNCATLGPRAFLNAGMRGGKGSAFNGGTRVASFRRWPGTPPPATVDKLTAHMDVLPILAGLAGARLPEDKRRDGISLVPLLKGEPATWPNRYLVTHNRRWGPGASLMKFTFGQCGVRWQEWNRVRGSDGELYSQQLGGTPPAESPDPYEFQRQLSGRK